MEASDIKKMKNLEDENRRLKQMFADLSPECRALKDVIEKALKPAIKRELVSYLTAQFAMSLRRLQDIVAEQDGISLSAGYAT